MIVALILAALLSADCRRREGPCMQQTEQQLVGLAKRLMTRWSDPVVFADDVLGVTVWPRQAEVLRAVAQHQRVAVRSGHKVSKSNSVAIISLWWVLTRPHARVILTSAGDNQISTILWPELRQLYARARWPIGGSIALDPRTGLRFPDGRVVFGFSTDSKERAAGQSGANLLYLVDEASGLDEEVVEAIEGNLAGGGRIALFGNPTQTSGTFFDAFHGKREFWHLIHISSEEAAQVTGIPGLATPEWVAEKRKQWGEDSPLYQVRVRGNFPIQSANSVIVLKLIEDAQARIITEPTGALHFGVDVARFGDDDSVIQPVRGKLAYAPIVVHGQDTVQVAGKVVEVATAMRKDDERIKIKVDVIGIGAGVADSLRAQERDWLEIVDVNVAEASIDESCSLLRDQLWFGVRDWLKDGSIPRDEFLAGELVAPRYKFDVRGRSKVEAKDEMKKRLGRSPDRADALALAIYDGGERIWVV